MVAQLLVLDWERLQPGLLSHLRPLHRRLLQFVYLKGDYDLIEKRLQARHGHYMRVELLKSQFQTMEEPGQALVVDVSQAPAVIVHQIRQAFDL